MEMTLNFVTMTACIAVAVLMFSIRRDVVKRLERVEKKAEAAKAAADDAKAAAETARNAADKIDIRTHLRMCGIDERLKEISETALALGLMAFISQAKMDKHLDDGR